MGLLVIRQMIEGWVVGKSKRLYYMIITQAQKQSLMEISSSNFYIYIKLGGLFLKVIWENRFTIKRMLFLNIFSH